LTEFSRMPEEVKTNLPLNDTDLCDDCGSHGHCEQGWKTVF